MNLDWIKVLPSKETPFNKEFFEKLSTSILDYAFPVGKTEIFYDAEDHSDYLGFKWERTSLERSPIGYNPDSTDANYKIIGNKFGEKKHALTYTELPDQVVTGFCQEEKKEWATGAWGNYSSSAYPTNVIANTNYIPANQSHNTIHPVEVIAFWKRVE